MWSLLEGRGVGVRFSISISDPGCAVLRKEGKGGELRISAVMGMLSEQGLWGRLDYECEGVYPTGSMVKTGFFPVVSLVLWLLSMLLWLQMLKTKATQLNESSVFLSLPASAILLIDICSDL